MKSEVNLGAVWTQNVDMSEILLNTSFHLLTILSAHVPKEK